MIHYLSEHPEYRDRLQFSINLSGRSISSEGFHRFLVQLLNSESVDATGLCFEITETAAVKDVAKSIEFISLIKQIGAPPEPAKDRDLRRALIAIAVGAGFLALGFAIPEDEATQIFGGFASFPIFIGLAYLAMHFFGSKDK